MTYSNDFNAYKEGELREVAQMHFINRMTHDKIASSLHVPRSKIVAMCDAARRGGLVQVAIMPSRRLMSEHLRVLASQMREKYGLLDCIVVNGRSQMLFNRLEDNFREMIVDEIARAAAGEVVRRFSEAGTPCLAVGYGFISRKMADCLTTPEHINTEGIVVAAQGVRRNEMDRFDANDVVRDLALRFGCRYACMPVPAVIDKDAVKAISRQDLVYEILQQLHNKTNIVFTSLGSLRDTHGAAVQPSPQSDSLGKDLLQKLDMDVIRERRGIGNIGGWFFDADGQEIDDNKHAVLGLSLDPIRKCVRDRKPVILAVGADPARIPAIAIALSTNLANVWIGDEISARILLGEYNIENHKDVQWSEPEMAVLKTLVK